MLPVIIKPYVASQNQSHLNIVLHGLLDPIQQHVLDLVTVSGSQLIQVAPLAVTEMRTAALQALSESSLDSDAVERVSHQLRALNPESRANTKSHTLFLPTVLLNLSLHQAMREFSKTPNLEEFCRHYLLALPQIHPSENSNQWAGVGQLLLQSLEPTIRESNNPDDQFIFVDVSALPALKKYQSSVNYLEQLINSHRYHYHPGPVLPLVHVSGSAKHVNGRIMKQAHALLQKASVADDSYPLTEQWLYLLEEYAQGQPALLSETEQTSPWQPSIAQVPESTWGGILGDIFRHQSQLVHEELPSHFWHHYLLTPPRFEFWQEDIIPRLAYLAKVPELDQWAQRALDQTNDGTLYFWLQIMSELDANMSWSIVPDMYYLKELLKQSGAPRNILVEMDRAFPIAHHPETTPEGPVKAALQFNRLPTSTVIQNNPELPRLLDEKKIQYTGMYHGVTVSPSHPAVAIDDSLPPQSLKLVPNPRSVMYPAPLENYDKPHRTVLQNLETERATFRKVGGLNSSENVRVPAQIATCEQLLFPCAVELTEGDVRADALLEEFLRYVSIKFPPRIQRSITDHVTTLLETHLAAKLSVNDKLDPEAWLPSLQLWKECHGNLALVARIEFITSLWRFFRFSFDRRLQRFTVLLRSTNENNHGRSPTYDPKLEQPFPLNAYQMDRRKQFASGHLTLDDQFVTVVDLSHDRMAVISETSPLVTSMSQLWSMIAIDWQVLMRWAAFETARRCALLVETSSDQNMNSSLWHEILLVIASMLFASTRDPSGSVSGIVQTIQHVNEDRMDQKILTDSVLRTLAKGSHELSKLVLETKVDINPSDKAIRTWQQYSGNPHILGFTRTLQKNQLTGRKLLLTFRDFIYEKHAGLVSAVDLFLKDSIRMPLDVGLATLIEMTLMAAGTAGKGQLLNEALVQIMRPSMFGRPIPIPIQRLETRAVDIYLRGTSFSELVKEMPRAAATVSNYWQRYGLDGMFRLILFQHSHHVTTLATIATLAAIKSTVNSDSMAVDPVFEKFNTGPQEWAKLTRLLWVEDTLQLRYLLPLFSDQTAKINQTRKTMETTLKLSESEKSRLQNLIHDLSLVLQFHTLIFSARALRPRPATLAENNHEARLALESELQKAIALLNR